MPWKLQAGTKRREGGGRGEDRRGRWVGATRGGIGGNGRWDLTLMAVGDAHLHWRWKWGLRSGKRWRSAKAGGEMLWPVQDGLPVRLPSTSSAGSLQASSGWPEGQSQAKAQPTT